MHILLGSLLILIDAFILNQGLLSGLVILIQLVIGIPNILRASSNHTRQVRLVTLAIYIGAALIVFTANYVNNRIAHHRAEVLISSIKAYKAAENNYPDRLQDLVPKYISAVPNAKFTLEFNKFYYSSDHHFLLYVSFPPFTRPTYSFDKEQWQVAD